MEPLRHKVQSGAFEKDNPSTTGQASPGFPLSPHPFWSLSKSDFETKLSIDLHLTLSLSVLNIFVCNLQVVLHTHTHTQTHNAVAESVERMPCEREI